MEKFYVVMEVSHLQDPGHYRVAGIFKYHRDELELVDCNNEQADLDAYKNGYCLKHKLALQAAKAWHHYIYNKRSPFHRDHANDHCSLIVLEADNVGAWLNKHTNLQP